MSESNEKQITESVDSKAVRKEQQQKEQKQAEKHSKALYTTIAVVFALIAVIVIGWRFISNTDDKDVPAVTINGQEYTAAEVNFYYKNIYTNFLNDNYYFLSYLGLDMNTSLKEQVITEDASALTGVEAGITWHDYILDKTLEQMACVQDILADAEANNYTYADSLQVTFDSNMFALESTAAANGVSALDYLKTVFGSSMTQEVYEEHLMRALQYEAYVADKTASFTYTAEDLEAAYNADPRTYDKASYEYVLLTGTPKTETDADGNTIEATEEETAAAKEAASKAAAEILTALQAGGDLKTLAEKYDNATYGNEPAGTYFGSTLTEWVFDDSRKAGDTASVESGSNYYVVLFHDRYRDTTTTIDIRHILLKPEAGTLASTDEGYQAEHDQLLADTKAKAEELLNQWKAGEATEESFAALANEHSADGGSNTNGGLYTGVQPGQMVPEFNDWCFEASREAGDTGIVYGTNGSYEGYHIMYFSGKNQPIWELTAENNLRNEDVSTWITSFGANPVVEKLESGMELVG